MAKEELLLLIKAETQKAVSEMKKMNQSISDTQSGLKKSVESFKNFALAAGGVIVAMKGISNAVGATIDKYKEQLNAETKLEAVLKATGGAAGYTAEELKQMAKEMQETTIYGDEMVINAQSVLATFTKIGKDVFPTAIDRAADLSAVLGQDLQTSVLQIGKVLNDPIANMGALGRAGIQFTDVQKDLIKGFWEMGDTVTAQNIILEEMNNQFGGTAQAVGETVVGKLAQLENSFGDLQEKIGQLLLTGFGPLIDTILDAVKFLDELAGGINQFLDQTAFNQIEATLKKASEDGASLATGMSVMMSMTGKSKDEILKIVASSEQLRGYLSEQEQIWLDINVLHKKSNEELENSSDYTEELQAKLEALREQQGGLNSDEKELTELQKRINELALEYSELIKQGHEPMDLYKQDLSIIYEQTQQINESLEEQVDRWTEITESINTTMQGIEPFVEQFLSLSEVTGQYYSNQLMQAENNYKNQKKIIEKNVKDENKRKEMLEKLDESYEEKQAAIKTRQAQSEKAWNITESIINTAVAATKALTAGPIIGPILASIIGGIGAAKTAMIAAAPIPQFDLGISNFKIPQGFDNDSFLMRGRTGETVNVNPMTESGTKILHVHTYLYPGAGEMGEAIYKMSQDGIIQIDEKAVV